MTAGFHCPICGELERLDHQCSRRALRRIERAHARASDTDTDEDGELTEAERIEQGFEIMRMSRPDEREQC